MSAFFALRIRIRDPDSDGVRQCRGRAHRRGTWRRGTCLRKFAEAVLRTGVPHATGVIRLGDLAAARAGFGLPGCRALSDLREAAGEMEFLVYDAF